MFNQPTTTKSRASAARACTIAMVLLGRGIAGAQAPTITPDPDPNKLGQYVVTIFTPALVDYAGTSTLDAGGNVTTTVLTQSTRGRVRGTTTTSGPAINGKGRLTGRVMTRNGLPFIQLRSLEHGDINGDETLSFIRSAARLEGSGSDSRLVGEMKIRYCAIVTDPIRDVKKKICSRNDPGMDRAAPHLGTWQVKLALFSSGTSVSGAGSIETGVLVGGGRETDVKVSGTIGANGLATVKLEPMDKSVLAGTVTLVGPIVENADGDALFSAVHEVKGRLLGQSFDEVFDSVP